jgi:hypothetical protein
VVTAPFCRYRAAPEQPTARRDPSLALSVRVAQSFSLGPQAIRPRSDEPLTRGVPPRRVFNERNRNGVLYLLVPLSQTYVEHSDEPSSQAFVSALVGGDRKVTHPRDERMKQHLTIVREVLVENGAGCAIDPR